MYLKNELPELTEFLQAGTNSRKLKDDWKFSWVDMVKNGCGQSGEGTLKLVVFEEWTVEINWFYTCWYRFTN